MRFMHLVLVLSLLSVCLPCVAQEPAQQPTPQTPPQPAQQPLTTKPVSPENKLPPKSRPSVGVALEGGGALGEA